MAKLMGVSLPIPEALAVAGGAAITQILHWWANRGRTKAYTMGAVDHAVNNAMGTMETVVDNLRDEVERLRAQMGDEAATCEAKLQAMRDEIDRLMSGPVASYAPRNP